MCSKDLAITQGPPACSHISTKRAVLQDCYFLVSTFIVYGYYADLLLVFLHLLVRVRLTKHVN